MSTKALEKEIEEALDAVAKEHYGLSFWFSEEQTKAALTAITEAGMVVVPREIDESTGQAMLDAMWPDGEVVYADAFSHLPNGPLEQLRAGHKAMLAAAEKGE